MMVPGIVEHQHHPCVAGAMPQQRLQEGRVRGCVERVAQGADERAGAQADGPKAGHRLTGGRMEQDGILDLGRDPHAAARAMLLEVAFVQTPQFNAPAPCQAMEFL